MTAPERKPRRKTGFEKDVLEFVVKTITGTVLGAVAWVMVPLWNPAFAAVPWWIYIGGMLFGTFKFSSWRHGDSKHAD
jgi:uncharacterized membrane protein YdcZ (DUF606 family)